MYTYMLCTRTRPCTRTLYIEHTHVHRHVQYTYTYTDMFTYIVHIHVHGHGHVHIHVHVHLHVHVHVNVYVHVHMHMHVHAHIHIHVRVHVHDLARGPQNGGGPTVLRAPEEARPQTSMPDTTGPQKTGGPTQSPKWSSVNRDFCRNPKWKVFPLSPGFPAFFHQFRQFLGHISQTLRKCSSFPAQIACSWIFHPKNPKNAMLAAKCAIFRSPEEVRGTEFHECV